MLGFNVIQSEVRPFENGEEARAVLCRTNAEVIGQAMQVLDSGKRPAVVGGGCAYPALGQDEHLVEREERSWMVALAAEVGAVAGGLIGSAIPKGEPP